MPTDLLLFGRHFELSNENTKRRSGRYRRLEERVREENVSLRERLGKVVMFKRGGGRRRKTRRKRWGVILCSCFAILEGGGGGFCVCSHHSVRHRAIAYGTKCGMFLEGSGALGVQATNAFSHCSNTSLSVGVPYLVARLV